MFSENRIDVNPTDSRPSYSERVRQILLSEMEKRGLSQTQLAQQAGIAQQSLNNFMRGITKSLHHNSSASIQRALEIDFVEIIQSESMSSESPVVDIYWDRVRREIRKYAKDHGLSLRKLADSASIKAVTLSAFMRGRGNGMHPSNIQKLEAFTGMKLGAPDAIEQSRNRLPTGWQCPACRTIYAPSVLSCACSR